MAEPDKLTGVRLRFWPSGAVRSQTLFDAGQAYGTQESWDPEGRIEKQDLFDQGKLKQTITYYRSGRLWETKKFDHQGVWYSASYDERGRRIRETSRSQR